ncbi:MAG: hypothetical protein HUU56_10920 [Bdellovibrionaceae bacterium]|nr:hypothetical protein [Pseudobdellovibrionaceae bacterium]
MTQISTKRSFSLPKNLCEQIESKLSKYNLSFSNSKKIADAILFMSDFYIENPLATTPWNERLTWIAQLSYYFPLNYLRNKAVIEEMKKFWNVREFSQIIDYGSGLGTSSWGFIDDFDPEKIYQFEKEPKLKNYWENTPFKWLNDEKALLAKIDRTSLGVFSYSLTEKEIGKTLSLLEKFNYLMIVEPSTQEDSRKLLEIRKKLIEKGYSIVAPCTHQLSCSLLEQSKRDWCHDRIHFEKPEWFSKIENHLPMRNDTLTFSYLLAYKTEERSRVLKKTIEIAGLARMTGDLQKEKGKTRQLICFNSERNFLTWIHKEITPPDLKRGSLIKTPKNLKTVSNELRVQNNEDIIPVTELESSQPK